MLTSSHQPPRRLLTLLPGLLLTLFLSAQNVYMVIDFMKVPENSDYVTVEQDIWKPMHQERINRGQLNGWYLFRVPFTGTSSDYNYVTLNIYDDPADIDSAFTDLVDIFTAVHPGKDANDVMQRTLNSRDLTKSLLLMPWKVLTPPVRERGTPKLWLVNYFKVPPGQEEKYIHVEQTYWMPIHEARRDRKGMTNWLALQVARPTGTRAEYNYLTFDIFHDRAELMQPLPEDLLTKVHPDKSLAELVNETNAARELVWGEEWHLVDFVAKQ